METVYLILVVLHLLGWAIAFGGVVAGMRKPALNPGVLHGVLTALFTGIILVGVASAGVAGPDINHTKITVKLIIALAVTAMVIFGGRNHEKTIARGYLGGIAGLIAVNVALAVLW
ncbi:hypothetical protein [Pseudactinotalea sp. Z1748]|uniref:hypothetical protein n=1 Tax=Pseudactinotalea sp. Z1748 TaxID=3413027 RepID=UPI003C7C1BA1